MPGAANVRETRIGLAIKPQSAVQTANLAADMISFTKLNDTNMNIELVTENDAKWIGKGNEFALNQYLSHWNANVSIEKYSTSQFLAFLVCFGFGSATKAAAGTGFTYTAVPQDPVVQGINMNTFSYLEAIRQGASTYVLDRVSIGMVVEEFQMVLGSGPGLNNSRLNATFVGTGMYTEPSGIAVPSLSTEAILPGGGMSLTINGVDYVSSANIVSLEWGWKNNTRLDTGFFPGSGFQTAGDGSTGAIRGRMEYGDRELTLRCQARFVHGSTELTSLRAQTSGTAVIGLTGGVISAGVHHSMSVTYQKTRFKTATVNNVEGIETVQFEILPFFDSVNGLVTAAVTTDQDGILGL